MPMPPRYFDSARNRQDLIDEFFPRDFSSIDGIIEWVFPIRPPFSEGCEGRDSQGNYWRIKPRWFGMPSLVMEVAPNNAPEE